MEIMQVMEVEIKGKGEKKKNERCKTTFVKSIVDSEEASSMFELLKESIEWEEGVRSKKGFTRKAKAIGPMEYPLILELVGKILHKMGKTNYAISHIYLNYYFDGQCWCPAHSHPGTHQLVISLGGTRTLEVNKKKFPMQNGDAILFGSASHGVPKEPGSLPRISIATFMVPISN